ncbi:glutathione ABC transporter ATP-binding protein GsiA [Pantoea rodasii]|uniref:ABC-type dipeptide transporter n=1 Tax=Pantoea rodasii TaxID=1076549 RepID=A0A2M9W6P9_9GAMM|nr:ABC transporter ATP-binding protein [Pantoea rodasii]ORM65522.1 glutathione ABC transporter ATP-binding protein GsiA [Pantoea rodasii]PJZ03207.1 glutathione ABC transporter ATP-binding protein GsiA [Pantoea rodasii]
MSALLSVENLQVRFGQHAAVERVSFNLAQGEMLALVGESGSGKSATALSIMGLLARQAEVKGRILFEGQDLLSLPKPVLRGIRGDKISMIFQEPMTSLNPVYSVGAQIAESLRLHQHLNRKQARARAIELLNLVNIPDPTRRVDDFPHQLSGGQRQRVMIAMAVACEPKLLIADEPTTALDVTVQANIMLLLDRLRRELSLSILMISHDLGVVSQWADNVAVMHHGTVVEQGSAEALFRHPKHDYTRGLMEASLSGDNDLHYRQRLLTEIRYDGQEQFHLHQPAMLPFEDLKSDAPLLSVNDLTVSYKQGRKRIPALQNVSFDLHAGETLGLVGESGCGKSTLSRTLLRLINADSGNIFLDGAEITHQPESALKKLRQSVQMIFQDPYASLNPRQSIFTILDSVLHLHDPAPAAQRLQRIHRMLDRVGLPKQALHRYAHEFSGGQRQRIGIARALIVKPRLVICDEAVSALDVSVQAQILNLLLEMKQEFGLSYLFISHNLAVVRYMSDNVLVMNQGEIVESGDVGQIWRHPQHPYTQQLLSAVKADAPMAHERRSA